MSLSAALAIAVLLGLVFGASTSAILRRLREPAPGVDPTSDPEPEEEKIPYAALATTRFAVAVAVLVTAAIAFAAATLPLPAVAVWVVLGTLGLLLAAIDARTTWLPLPLTRAAWLATGAALLLGGTLGDWSVAARGGAGFLLAGALFWLIWLLTRGGFGFGDVRYAPLVGAATAAVSWTVLAWALVLGSLVGAMVGAVRLALGRRGAFAYAPAILAGGYLAVAVAWLTT